MGLFSRSPAPAPYSKPRAVTGAASKIKLADKDEVEQIRMRSTTSAGWQHAAWTYYDSIGEVSFAFNLVASVLSRIRLLAAVVVDPDAPPVEITDAIKIEREDTDEHPQEPGGVDVRIAVAAREYLEDLNVGAGIPAINRAYGLNMAVVGECYLTCIRDKWAIRSTSEVTVDAAGDAYLQTSSGTGAIGKKKLPKKTPIGRIWRAHPRYSTDADSSMRPLAADCEELLLLSRMIRTTTRSRLNAGMVFIPDTISTAGSSVDEAVDENGDPIGEEDAFERELIEAMTAPVADEQSAASIVPLLIRGPETAGDKIKLIEMSRTVDQKLVDRADRVLDRILQGLDVPKDVVTGLANVKYSNAIQIDESMYKAHVEPLALLLVDAITEIYLQPLLRAKAAVEGWDEEEVARVVVWYDPSEVVTHPDRGQDANEGWDRNVLSDSAWRQAHGFSDADAPDEEELARRTALKQAPLPPEVLQVLLQKTFPDILSKARAADEQQSGFPPSLDQALAGQPAAPAAPAPATPTPPAEEAAPPGPPQLQAVQ